MYTKTIKHLTIIKEEMEELLDTHSEKLLNCRPFELQNDIERNVIDRINEIIEEIEIITENIETGSYESNSDLDPEDDNY